MYVSALTQGPRLRLGQDFRTLRISTYAVSSSTFARCDNRLKKFPDMLDIPMCHDGSGARRAT